MSNQYVTGTHKTTVKQEGGTLRVTYHWTDVVTVFDETTEKGTEWRVKLDSGGWQTPTTKTRMNQTSNQFDLGFYVFQKNFQWYVKIGKDTLEFEDNMSFPVIREVVEV